MPTEQELQAEIERLKQKITESAASIAEASKIQNAFRNLPLKERKYLDALAKGEEPEPLVVQPPTPEPDPDVDTGAALKALEERLMGAVEQRLGGVVSLLEQKANVALTRAMGVESQNSMRNVQQWFEQTYPGMSFDAYRAKAAEKANGSEALLQTEAGLKTLLEAAVAPDLIEYGRTQAAQEKARVQEMANSVFGGPVPGAAKGGDEDDFSDLDWDNDPDGAFLKAFEREGVHLQGH